MRKGARTDHPGLVKLRTEIEAGIAARGVSHWKIAALAGLPEGAIRSVLDGRDPQWSTVWDIVVAMGMNLDIGPPGRVNAGVQLSQEALDLAVEFDRCAASRSDTAEALGEIVAAALRHLERRRAGGGGSAPPRSPAAAGRPVTGKRPGG